MTLDFDNQVVVDAYRLGGTPAVRRELEIVRRLSARVVFIEIGGYQCTLVLGRESALLVDPLDTGRAARVIKIVRETFGLEISTLVYSHMHWDHISGAAHVMAESRYGVDVAIHAALSCAEGVASRQTGVVPSVVHADGESFDFEGTTVTLSVVGGHTPDLTLILFPEEQVAHAVDLIHPGQAEFFDFGRAIDIWSFERALDALAAASWRVLCAGHGDIGWPTDVTRAQSYLRDLRAVTAAAVDEAVVVQGVSADTPNSRADILRRSIRDGARTALLASWSVLLPGLEYTLDSHIDRMADELLYFGG